MGKPSRKTRVLTKYRYLRAYREVIDGDGPATITAIARRLGMNPRALSRELRTRPDLGAFVRGRLCAESRRQFWKALDRRLMRCLLTAFPPSERKRIRAELLGALSAPDRTLPSGPFTVH